MCKHTPDSLHDGLVHPLGHPVQLWHFRHGVFEPDSLRPVVLLELPLVFPSVIRSYRFKCLAGFSVCPRMELLEGGQYLVLRLQCGNPQLSDVVIY